MRLHVRHQGDLALTGASRPAAVADTPGATSEPGISLQAAFWHGQACCCAAKPAVLVIVPPSADREGPTELLLCWRHYVVSQHSLTASRAIACLADSTAAD